MTLATRFGDFTRHLGKIYGLYTVGFVAFVLLLFVLEQVGVPNRVIGSTFVFGVLAVYAGIGIAARTMQVGEFYVAGRRVPAIWNGMATAASWLSTVAFIGMAGTLYALGYDGLSYVLGWTGGYVLVAVLIAPYLRKFGAYTVPDFFAARFGGHAARVLGVVVLVSSCFVYVVGQVYGIGVVLSRFLGLSLDMAVYVGLASVLLCTLLGGMKGLTWTQVAQYIVLAIAYLVPVALVSADLYGWPIPQLTYGRTLIEIGALERSLAAELADAAPGHAQAFAGMDAFNFFALVICLMVGTASLPHVLMRSFTTRSVRAARTSAGWALLFIVLLCMAAPAYAAFAKAEIYLSLVGATVEALPNWVYVYGNLSLVQVCGVDATGVEAIRAACAAAGNAGELRVEDLVVNGGAIVVAFPEILGLPYVVTALVAVGAMTAALATANGLLVAMANSLSYDIHHKMLDRNAPIGRRLLVARLILVSLAVFAAWLAAIRQADLLSMMAWAFSLAAAGNFPALVLGIWWKRCNAAGAVAGMIAGFGTTLFYLLMTKYGGMPLWPVPGLTEGIEDVSAAIIGLPVGFAVTILVSLYTRRPAAEVEELVDEIRLPRGGIVTSERAA